MGIDRLPRYAYQQGSQISAVIESRLHARLRDRPIKVLRLIFFAAPDELDGHPGKLFRDDRCLADLVLRAATATEAAAQHLRIRFALIERQTGRG